MDEAYETTMRPGLAVCDGEVISRPEQKEEMRVAAMRDALKAFDAVPYDYERPFSKITTALRDALKEQTQELEGGAAARDAAVAGSSGDAAVAANDGGAAAGVAAEKRHAGGKGGAAGGASTTKTKPAVAGKGDGGKGTDANGETLPPCKDYPDAPQGT